MIKGAVPGSKGGWVTVRDAVKRRAPDGLPTPAAIRVAEVAEATVTETPAEAPAGGGEE
jgi:large subunit ribosomal protein L3